MYHKADQKRGSLCRFQANFVSTSKFIWKTSRTCVPCVHSKNHERTESSYRFWNDGFEYGGSPQFNVGYSCFWVFMHCLSLVTRAESNQFNARCKTESKSVKGVVYFRYQKIPYESSNARTWHSQTYIAPSSQVLNELTGWWTQTRTGGIARTCCLLLVHGIKKYQVSTTSIVWTIITIATTCCLRSPNTRHGANHQSTSEAFDDVPS